MPIGAKVTLRGDRMWEFLDRLISVVLPRIRDFRGLNPRTFDGHGNYTFGLTEQLVFPEIDYDKIEKVRGMDITVVTSAETDDQGRALLTALGFPFRRVDDGSGKAPARANRQDQEVAPPDGKEVFDRQGQAHPEVQGAGLHALPALRAAASRAAQVRPVPDLRAPARPRRRAAGRHQVELVRGGGLR